MRFAVAHKAATYLMVGFAYLAMIAGGAVAPMIALAGLVGLVGSWWWEPPNIRFERWSWVWTTSSVFALVYSVLTAIVTGDFLGVGAQFLIWLVVAKAYNRRAARDWQQMYLLAFLMLVAGSVLNWQASPLTSSSLRQMPEQLKRSCINATRPPSKSAPSGRWASRRANGRVVSAASRARL